MKFRKTILSFLFLFILAITQSSSQDTAPGDDQLATITRVAKLGCQSQCGNITIPYPFGIGPGCFHSQWFEVTCDASFNPPKTFIDGLPILEISDSTFRVPSRVANQCYNELGNLTEYNKVNISLGWTSPFSFSQKNKFFLIGCDDFALYQGPLQVNFTSGWIGLCSQPQDVVNGSCSGIGCCQTTIPKGIKSYYNSIGSLLSNHTTIWSFNPCSYSFLGEQEQFSFHGVSDMMDPNFISRTRDTVPMLIDWVVGNLSCSEARTASVLSCQANTRCIDSDTGIPGYRCICNQGFQGQPYLDPGCQG